jgi:hypothetical protein
MTRLQTEIHRLYGAPTGDGEAAVRALVLELARPADWSRLAQVWQGVQADLGWPAPAIAVNGVDGYQLWFSLPQPLPPAEAQHLLDHLCGRYLADVTPERLRRIAGHPPTIPRQVAADAWSAFVTSDLAAVFADTPWLDLPPGEDAQAELLGRLSPIATQDLHALLKEPAAPAAPVVTVAPPPRVTDDEARQFLLSVMRDPAVELALRIDAAKALLR